MTSSPVELVPRLLSHYGVITRERLVDYLPATEPKKYLYDIAADYPNRGGRALRPSICIANASIFGATVEQAVLSACSIELMHNALLVHDDIEDESEIRRGAETLHKLHGTPMAINVGDALMSMSFQPLLDNIDLLGEAVAMQILLETNRMARVSAEGQAMELGWRHDNVIDLEEDDYLLMVSKKTAWLSCIHPLRVGAIIGSKGKFDVDPFIRFGFFLGTAFQIQDDLLNLVGNEAKYGKELAGDIEEGKRTLMLIHLLRHSTSSEQQKLAAILGMTRVERREHISWVIDLMFHYGSLEYARKVAHSMVGAALFEFSKIYGHFPTDFNRDFIEGLPHWVITRG